MTDPQILSAGTLLQLGKYKIVGRLGQGSFGITYLAAAKIKMTGALGEIETEIHVAVKEFFMSDINSRSHDGTGVEGSSGTVFTNYRRKFRKEAETLARLSHDNIVHVIDVFDENNTTYYVMQYVDGGSLDDYIASRGQLSEGETFAILRDVGAALSYMHRHKMLHLDLKPKNIMRRGSDGHIFLIDFGLSKYFTEGGEPESSTTIGHGTPGYAPLEQARYRHDGAFPATIDVYALGATAFKMLTGKRPPEASDILNDGFPSDDLLSLGVSRPTEESIRRAMSAERRARYQTVDEFLSALCPADDVATSSSSSAAASEDTVLDDAKRDIAVSVIASPSQKHDSQPDYVPPTSYWGCWRSAWRNKFNFKGRANRREFWSIWLSMVVIWSFLIYFFEKGAVYTCEMYAGHTGYWEYPMFVLYWLGLYLFLFILSTISLEIRRLRDSGHSLWWAVIFNVLLVMLMYERWSDCQFGFYDSYFVGNGLRCLFSSFLSILFNLQNVPVLILSIIISIIVVAVIMFIFLSQKSTSDRKNKI